MIDEASQDFQKQLRDYRLTTAEIIYHMPDHPSLLQSYIWQDLDLAPRFPVLHKFLKFWECRLDGRLYMVKVAHMELISPGGFRYHEQEFDLH